MAFGTNYGNGTGYGTGYGNYGTTDYDNLPPPADNVGDMFATQGTGPGTGLNSDLTTLAGGVGALSKYITDPSGGEDYIKTMFKREENELKTAFDNTASAGFGDGTEEEQQQILAENGLAPSNETMGYVNGQETEMSKGIFA